VLGGLCRHLDAEVSTTTNRSGRNGVRGGP
jgi:hypothetical protein